MQGEYWFGFDLGLKQPAVAVFDIKKMDFIYVGSVNTEKIYATKLNKGLYLNGIKLNKILEYFNEIIEQFPPKEVFIERGFSRFNAETQTIYRTHGIVNCTLWKFPQEYFPPKTIKLTIALDGNASKSKVKKAIEKRFPNLIMNNEDESDAVATLLTGLIKRNIITWEKPIKIVKTTKPKKPRKKKEGKATIKNNE